MTGLCPACVSNSSPASTACFEMTLLTEHPLEALRFARSDGVLPRPPTLSVTHPLLSICMGSALAPRSAANRSPGPHLP